MDRKTRPVAKPPRMTMAELIESFNRSASDEALDMPSRQLAARMTILATHVAILSGRTTAIGEVAKQTRERTVKIDEGFNILVERLKPIFVAPEAEPGQPQPTQEPEVEPEVEAPEDDVIERMQRETAEEVERVNVQQAVPEPAPQADMPKLPAKPVKPVKVRK